MLAGVRAGGPGGALSLTEGLADAEGLSGQGPLLRSLLPQKGADGPTQSPGSHEPQGPRVGWLQVGAARRESILPASSSPTRSPPNPIINFLYLTALEVRVLLGVGREGFLLAPRGESTSLFFLALEAVCVPNRTHSRQPVGGAGWGPRAVQGRTCGRKEDANLQPSRVARPGAESRLSSGRGLPVSRVQASR